MSVQTLADGTTIEDPIDYIASLIFHELESGSDTEKRYARLVLFNMLEENERTVCMSQITQSIKNLIIGGKIENEQRIPQYK